MEKSFSLKKKKNVPTTQKEVFKDLGLDNHPLGRDSPESGSLYSDYESGQQYEDKDLPSGYNSGEQYDTLSTGYMSGEAYELPETRQEMLEPTLASIDEVSHKSNEELFSLHVPGDVSGGQLLVQQMEQLSSSSSSDSIPEVGAEMTAGKLESLAIHKTIRAKKQVSYHVSVPMDKSPLGNDGYREIPSDTDTTSCFDSDGTYIRSEAQSSDSGAALLSHSKRRGRDHRKGGRGGGGGGRNASLNRKLKKAKHVIRSHEDFFRCHDTKYWAWARMACFWASILSILICIGTAGVMIGVMPRSCDPETEWWQGGVILDIGLTWGQEDGGGGYLNITDLIGNVAKYKAIGIQAIKLRNLYRKYPGNISDSNDATDWLESTDDDVIRTRMDLDLMNQLSQTLHDHQMKLMVEIPAMEKLEETGMMSLNLIQNVTRAIKSWAEYGVDAISIVGLEHFARDPYIAKTVENWKINFNKYGTSRGKKILSASYLLPKKLEEADNAYEDLYSGIASFELLDATIVLGRSSHASGSDIVEESDNSTHDDLAALVDDVARWDHAPSQPWILWSMDIDQVMDLHQAELAINMLLPGTISLQINDININDDYFQKLLAKLIAIRHTSVPIYMNGNYKTCHAHCDGAPDKVDNYKVHQYRDNDLVLLERNFNRRNRYMVIANLGSSNASLTSVASLYSGGDVILDTKDLDREVTSINFKDVDLPSQHAYVIKFPK